MMHSCTAKTISWIRSITLYPRVKTFGWAETAPKSSTVMGICMVMALTMIMTKMARRTFGLCMTRCRRDQRTSEWPVIMTHQLGTMKATAT